MCKGCWEAEGSPTKLPDNADQIIALIVTLYAMESCSTGGPLHVEIDDFNIGDEFWVPYRPDFARFPHIKPYPEESYTLSQDICDLMLAISKDQRAAVLAKWEGWTA